MKRARRTNELAMALLPTLLLFGCGAGSPNVGSPTEAVARERAAGDPPAAPALSSAVASDVAARGGLTARGRVTDLSGDAVKGAEVFFYTSADTRRPADYISPWTDEGGRYAAALPAGSYWVVARVRKSGRYGPLMPGDQHSGAAEEVTITASEVLVLDFVVAGLRQVAQQRQKVRADFFHVEGQVLSLAGEPLADRYVVGFPKKGGSGLPAFISAWTGADGRYSLYVPQGRLWIAVAFRFPLSLDDVEMLDEANLQARVIEGDVHDFDLTEANQPKDSTHEATAAP